jgi:aldehyde dehydrogenase (NAD+)
MKIHREEIFGPVVVVMKFKDEEDVVKQANDTVYGLASAIHSTDVTKALRVSKRIKAGTVWINCYNRIVSQVPFGGYKESGIGREVSPFFLVSVYSYQLYLLFFLLSSLFFISPSTVW